MSCPYEFSFLLWVQTAQAPGAPLPQPQSLGEYGERGDFAEGVKKLPVGRASSLISTFFFVYLLFSRIGFILWFCFPRFLV